MKKRKDYEKNINLYKSQQVKLIDFSAFCFKLC